MARDYIYTAPGSTPTGVETEGVTDVLAAWNPLNLGASFVGSLLDIGAEGLKGLIDLGEMQGRKFEALGRQRPGLAELADSPIGDLIRSIPEGIAKEKLQDFGTFGQREQIAQDPQGKALLDSAEYLGMLTSLPFLGAIGPVAEGLNVAADWASLSPGATQVFNLAKTVPQITAAGAGVGGTSMALPAVHRNYDPATGELDMPGVRQDIAIGAGVGGGLALGLGAVGMAPQVWKGAKDILDNIVQGAGQMIKQSDNLKIYKEVKQAAAQREQMQQFAQAQEAEVAKAYAPEVKAQPEVPRVEKTFAKEVPSYEEIPNVTKMQEEDLIRLADDEMKLSKELETKTAKYEDEINTLSSYIEEAKAKPVEVADAEINKALKGPKTQREVVDELRAARTEEIKAERTPIKEQIDTAMSKQMTLKEKEKNLAKLIKEKTPEELQKDFGKPIEKVQATVQKDLEKNEIAIGKLQKKLDKIDAKLEKTIPVKKTEVEARMAEINQERDKLRQELLQQKEAEKQKLVEELETEADNVFNRYDDEKTKYQDQLAKIQKQRADVESFAPKPQLSAVIEKAPEVVQPKPRFISGRQEIKEYDPQTGLPVSVKETVSPQEQIGVTPEGDIVIPGKTEKDLIHQEYRDNFGGSLALISSKPKLKSFTPIVSAIGKESQYLGGKFAKLRADSKLAQSQLKINGSKVGLHRAIVKHQNNDAVMASLGNASLESQKIASLNKKLDELTDLNNVKETKDLDKILKAEAEIKQQIQEHTKLLNYHKSQLPEDLRVGVEAIQPTVKEIAEIPIQYGYDIQLSDFYFPFRVRDFEMLAKIDGDIDKVVSQYLDEINRELQTPKTLGDLSPEQISILDDRLQKQKVVNKYTPEMMKAYRSMPEAYDIFSRQMGEAYGESLLFRDNVNKDWGSELMPKLILEAHAEKPLTPKQASKLMQHMTTYFGSRAYVPPAAYKFITNSISMYLITGIKTSLAQFTSAITNLRKSGMLETAESIDHILKVLGGKRPSLSSRLNPGATMGTVNDVVVDSLANMKEFFTGQYVPSSRTNLAQKLGSTYETTLYAPLQGSDWLEKESTFAANYAWLKNNVGKKNYVASFKDRYASAFSPEEWKQLEKDLHDLKQHKGEEISDLVYAAIDLRSGEQVVTHALDKSGLALGNTFERMTMQLQSYAMKIADEMDLVTRRTAAQGIAEYKEGLKTGNKEMQSKGIDKIYDAGIASLSIASVLPVWTFVNAMRFGDSFEKAWEKAKSPVEWARALLSMAFPATFRGLKMASDLRVRDTGHADTLVNAVNPGLATTARIYGDTIGTIAKGKSPWSEENPSWKYMPPRMLNEYLYEKSYTGANRKAKRELAQSGVMQQEQKVEFAKQLDKLGLLTPETIGKLDDKEFKREIRRLQTDMSRLENYGTTDPRMVAELKIKLTAFDQAERHWLGYLEAMRRNGRLTDAQYQQALKTKNERIMKMLDQMYKAGKL